MSKEKVRVLTVENNRELCEVLKTLVTSQGDLEWVGAAYDGAEALDKIAETKPDVILLDIVMPYLDGLGVLQRVSEMDLPKRPRVIVLTAFEGEGMIRRAARFGADYYILKPFDKESLISRIRQLAGLEREHDDFAMSGGDEGPVGQIDADKVDADQVEEDVARLLYNLGVPTYFKGYLYLKEAIKLVTEEVDLLRAITKVLYPKIAEKYGTTPLIVEAAIRYTIQKTWRQGNPEYINKIFGYTVQSEGR